MSSESQEETETTMDDLRVTKNDNDLMGSLPQDVLEKLFSYLEMKDLCTGVELVCKSFREVSITSNKMIWRAIALRRYGSKIIEESVAKNAYNASFKDLVADDNKLIAMPTIGVSNHSYYPIPCYLRFNCKECFYVCLVVGIQYHRPTDEIRIYIDVRGENEVRHVNTCSIQCGDGRISKSKGFWGRTMLRESNCIGSCRYKGYVSFDASVFHYPGVYNFVYADRRTEETFCFQPEFCSVPIFAVLPGQGSLERSFLCEKKENKVLYALENWSPFAMDDDDSKEKADLEWFRPFVYHLVWKRHDAKYNIARWWVEGEKRSAAPSSSIGSRSNNNSDGSVYTSFVDSLAQNQLADFCCAPNVSCTLEQILRRQQRREQSWLELC